MDNPDHNHLDVRQDSNTTHNDESLLRPRSLSIQSRRSWPLLPTIQVVNSIESDSNRYSIRSPIIDEDAASTNSTSSESESTYSEKQDPQVYDIMEDKDKNNTNADYDVNRRRSTLKGSTTRNSADTLVEAALDQDEARDRHVRFPDHIAEAGTLVQRMLSTKYPNTATSPTLSTSYTIDEGPDVEEDADLELQSTRSPKSNTNYNNNTGGGSVLASLMKLEAQKRQPPVKRKKTHKKKKVTTTLIKAHYSYDS